jgi:phospholipid-binding lipoprotein MlaA
MVQGILRSVAGLRRSVVFAAAVAALAGGCASTDTKDQDVWDPLEVPNRFVFSINRAVDIIAIRPLAVIYRDWMPEPGQKGVRNALDNIQTPVTAINEVIQGSPKRAANSMARFLVNSTIGVAGLFDVASSLGLAKTKEDAGKTIGMYAGVPPENGGPYLVLPLAGPSNFRDAS